MPSEFWSPRCDEADSVPISVNLAQYDAPEKDLYEMGEIPPMGYVPKQLDANQAVVSIRTHSAGTSETLWRYT